MATIPRSLLDSLTDEINALSGAGRQMVENALSRIVPMFADADGSVPNERVSDLRAAVCEVMETVCGEVSDLSAARSAEFYDQVRERSVGSTLGALAESTRKPAATDGAVRALMKSVVDTGSTERLVRELGDRVDYEVKKAAGDCVEFNAGRDPLKPKFARVPNGAETCSFCLMIASFGFAYGSKKAAGSDGHYHTNCNCRIVPGFDGQTVEGYDPDDMYTRTKACLDTLGGRDGIRKDWNALPEDKRDSYIARHGGKPGRAFDAYVSKRLSDEIGLRSPKWFQTGKRPIIEYSDEILMNKKLKDWRKAPNERKTAEELNKLGFETIFWDDEIHEANPSGKGTTTIGRSDLSNGIEIKSLDDASSENTFSKHLSGIKKKRGVKMIVIDVSRNKNLDDDVSREYIASSLRRHDISDARMIKHSGEMEVVRAKE